MSFAEFFDQVPSIKLHDGLSQVLGATDDGVMEYRYVDAARLAGHSCPTVAGAWLSVVAGLKALYPDALPERGGVSVFLPDGESEGATGVIGQVVTLVTGAAAANGFHGLGPNHRRSGLLHYGVPGVTGMRLTRNDTGATVEVVYNPRTVPSDPTMSDLMGPVVHGMATPEQARAFGQLWQDRVRRILLEHADDGSMIRVRAIAEPALS